MTRDSFDLVVRRLATAPSRRSLLQLLTATILGRTFATIAPSATAAPKRKQRPVACQKLNRACTKRKPCCPRTKCLRGRCRCPATAKPCAGACIPRTACCPATGDGCGGAVCHPSNGCCPSSGTKLCGQNCIALDACCTNSDCAGPCVGVCVAGRCQQAARGTPCGDGTRQCNSQGVCAQPCIAEDNECPQPRDDTTPAEFCRQAVCENQICEETHEPDYTRLPPIFQTRGDCKELECVHNLPHGIGISSDYSHLDVPDDPSDCVEAYCHGIDQPRTRNRPPGTPCNGDAGQCDGQGVCN